MAPRPGAAAQKGIMSETLFTPGPDTARALRDAYGCFSTGVTVVTVGSSDGPIGFTANSFSSVSLDPPLVLWCPARASSRHAPFIDAARFAIHILAEDQSDLARRFARSGDSFAGIDWSQDEDGVPILAGCLARFDCERHAVHEAGDHSIIVGRVLQAMHRQGGAGLVFKRGAFGSFAALL